MGDHAGARDRAGDEGDAAGEAVADFTRRLAFSVLIGNSDMHLKNWSLLYQDRRTASLAPAYDYVSTIAYLPNDQLALGFGGSKDISSISQDQIRCFADAARLAVSPLWRIVQETSEKTVSAWQSLGEKDHIPAKLRKAIDAHIAAAAGQ